MAGYKVITSAMRAEAQQWDKMAENAKVIRHQVASATLGPAAFFCGDPTELDAIPDATLHQKAYEDIRSTLESLAGAAETEFGQFADVLIRISQKYDQAEDVVEVNLDKAYSE